MPLENHHLRTREILDDRLEGNLRREFDVLDADGGNVAPNLKRKVDIIAASPLDDVVNEGPHARARRSTLGTPHHGSAEIIWTVVFRELILRCRGVTPFSGGRVWGSTDIAFGSCSQTEYFKVLGGSRLRAGST